MHHVLHREGDLTVLRRDAHDARWVELLSAVSWGTEGLRMRMNDIGHTLERCAGAHFLELVRGEELLAVLTLIPHRHEIAGTPIRAWYRSLLAVKPGRAGGGIGGLLTRTARRVYLDEATGPTLLYGYIETENARSLRLQERLGYTLLFEMEAATFGWLFPRDAEGVERSDDRDAFLAALRRFWAGHLFDDLDETVRAEDLWVLKRGGRVVAGAQVVLKSVSIEALHGLQGKLLLLGAPVLHRLTRFFSTDPHTMVWTGPVFYEGDDPAPLVALLQAVQRRLRASSGLWYIDPRSPVRARVASSLGPVHSLSPSPLLRAMAGWKDLPDSVLESIRRGPIVASALDSA